MTTLPITAAGLRRGVLLTTPLLPGCVAFALAFGAVAAKQGLSLAEATLMSALVYAGASQMAALAAWQGEWTLAAGATAVLLVAAVNSRLILMGAAFRPWFAPMPQPQAYALLALNTDASWIMSLREETATKRRDVGVYLGVAVTLWVFWVAATPLGWALGGLIADPRAYALDLVMLVFFAVMLVPLWKGPRAARPWVVAGAAALLVQQLVPGHAYIVAGAAAGAIAGALLDG
jgi:predicted branched-subunit amino acid permease